MLKLKELVLLPMNTFLRVSDYPVFQPPLILRSTHLTSLLPGVPHLASRVGFTFSLTSALTTIFVLPPESRKLVTAMTFAEALVREKVTL